MAADSSLQLDSLQEPPLQQALTVIHNKLVNKINKYMTFIHADMIDIYLYLHDIH